MWGGRWALCCLGGRDIFTRTTFHRTFEMLDFIDIYNKLFFLSTSFLGGGGRPAEIYITCNFLECCEHRSPLIGSFVNPVYSDH